MSKLTDNKLDRMLGEYFAAAPGYSFTFDPDAETEHTPIPTRRFRMIAAAAAVVLVSALSLSAYFLFRNKANDPIAFSPVPQSSVTPTKPGADGSETPTYSAVTGETEATAATTGNTEKPTVRSTYATTPTSAARGSSPTSETERVSGTQPTQTPSQSPTQSSTQSVTVPMTAPTQFPTSAPTQKPTAAPTQAPTQPPTESPNEHPAQESDEDYFIGISIPRQPPGTEIFCGIYDMNGNFMGDPDPYSAQHSAELFTESDGISYALYYPLKHGLTFGSSGKYPYRIYDKNGNELASYYIYVM